MRRLDHIRKVREHFGTRATILRVGDRVLRVVGCEVHKVLFQDGRLIDRSAVPDPNCTFRRLMPDDVQQLAADEANRIPASFVDRARSDHHLCFGTFWGSRLAAYAWYAIGSIDAEQNAGVPMSYPLDTACVYRGFTHPEFRGQAVHELVRPQLFPSLAEFGITKLVALVSWTNWPSLQYCHRVGYRDIGYLITVGPSRRRWFGPREAASLGIQFGHSLTATEHP